ncbi:MAG: AAA family ATPase [Gammaproteobacteria bacterium]|nr:MAG: AAA family ATPase [Gammaproteobacteria bacterium]
MYEQFYGFKEKPFSLLPDPSFLYMTKKHQMALTMLEYSLMNESAGICVVSGEIGSGKTTLVRQLLSTMDDRYTTGMITNTHSSFGDLLQWVSMAYGLEYRGKERVELYEDFVNFMIKQYSTGKRTVLIIDEAQNMEEDTLEELRMLSNVNSDKNQVLQLILVGQPELRTTLRSERLMQLAQRVSVSYHLDTLKQAETALYIRHRMSVAGGSPDIFNNGACKAVWYYSRGVPRVINVLCDTALVYGFAEEKDTVNAKIIHDVANDRKTDSIFADVPDDNADNKVIPITPDLNKHK